MPFEGDHIVEAVAKTPQQSHGFRKFRGLGAKIALFANQSVRIEFRLTVQLTRQFYFAMFSVYLTKCNNYIS